jgi:hypothetical protein
VGGKTTEKALRNIKCIEKGRATTPQTVRRRWRIFEAASRSTPADCSRVSVQQDALSPVVPLKKAATYRWQTQFSGR